MTNLTFFPRAPRGGTVTRARLTWLVLLLPSALALLGCSFHAATDKPPTPMAPPPAGNIRFDRPEFGFTFDYPRQLRLTTNMSYGQGGGSLSTGYVRVGPTIYSQDFITIGQLPLQAAVNDANQAKPEIDQVMAMIAGGPVTGTPVTVAGLPGIEYANIPLHVGTTPALGRYIYFFEGAIQYRLQYVSTAEHRAEMDMACQTVLDTLRHR